MNEKLIAHMGDPGSEPYHTGSSCIRLGSLTQKGLDIATQETVFVLDLEELITF